VVRAIRSSDPQQRLILAATTAGAGAFAFAAGVEWIWLIPVLPVAFFVLASAAVTPAVAAEGVTFKALSMAPAARGWRRPPWFVRAIGTLACLGAVLVVALPMAATETVRDSQSLVRAGNLGAALAKAKDATRLQPYAASPWLQEALVQEALGRIPQALVAAQHAAREGPTDYNNWLVASRLEARDGRVHAALADYLRARSLSPRATIFAR
jgi:tetratricopeptide (TPR) repeat protein